MHLGTGFDAHKDDPLAGIALKEDDYGWVTREICAVASRVRRGAVRPSAECHVVVTRRVFDGARIR